SLGRRCPGMFKRSIPGRRDRGSVACSWRRPFTSNGSAGGAGMLGSPPRASLFFGGGSGFCQGVHHDLRQITCTGWVQSDAALEAVGEIARRVTETAPNVRMWCNDDPRQHCEGPPLDLSKNSRFQLVSPSARKPQMRSTLDELRTPRQHPRPPRLAHSFFLAISVSLL